MPAIFPKWTNQLPALVIVGGMLLGTSVLGGVWYYFSPKYTRVGYQPIQPVAFPHSVHADQLGIDCRYCHSAVEKSWYSNIPTATTCMNCHNQVLKDDPRLALVRESAATGKPIPWVQVHKVPDYVYFNHSVHVNRGVSCVHCHGQRNVSNHGDGDGADEFGTAHRRLAEHFWRDPAVVWQFAAAFRHRDHVC